MEPKCHPKRIKIEDKNEDEKKHLLRSSWNRLGSILGSSWEPSGVKKVARARAGAVFLKIHVFEKMRRQEATWAELSSTWAPKSLRNGAQERAKTDQKKRRNMR